MHHNSLPWSRLAIAALGAIALTSLGSPAVAESTQAETCPAGTVTVVVDFTDLGGEVEIGCATDASTGTAALRSAGFADIRDASGLICAIDSRPDPCPAEFAGSYWSYWYAEDGEWLTWMEGSDTAVPAAGGVEGWRYNDGLASPGVDPDDLPAPADAGAAVPAADDEVIRADGVDPWVFAAVAAAILAAALLAGARLLRRGQSNHGPYGQD